MYPWKDFKVMEPKATSVAAFVAVPLLGTFLPTRMRTRNSAQRNHAAII